jgi:hypothetical protein
MADTTVGIMSHYWKISEGPTHNEFYFDEDDAREVYDILATCINTSLFESGKAATTSTHLVAHEYDEDDKEEYFLGNDEECYGDELKYEVYALLKIELGVIAEDELRAHFAKLHEAKYNHPIDDAGWEFTPLTQYQYEDLKRY